MFTKIKVQTLNTVPLQVALLLAALIGLLTLLYVSAITPIVFCLVVLLGMVVFLILNKTPPAIVMLSTLAYLILGNKLSFEKFFTTQKALIGFSQHTVLLIGILIVIAAAIKNTGLIDSIIFKTLGNTNNPKKAFLRLSLPLMATSAFLNNTSIVAIIISTVRDWANRHNVNPSSLLLPFVYITTFGGMLTLVGTTTILLVNSLNLQYGIKPIGFFTPAIITLPISLVSILYLQKFIVSQLDKKSPFASHSLTDDSSENGNRLYSLEMMVTKKGQFDGKSIADIKKIFPKTVVVVEVKRNNKTLALKFDLKLTATDILVLASEKEQILKLRQIKGLLAPQEMAYLNANLSNIIVKKDERFIEVVISNTSPLLGKTLNHILFHQKYNAEVLAIHRHIDTLRINILNTTIKYGDVLLLHAKKGFRRIWQNTDDFYVISPLRSDLYDTARAPITIAIVLPMILLPAFNLVSIFYTSIAAFVMLLITGCINANNVVKQIDWNVLLVIGCAFGISAAVEGSGASYYLSQGFILTGKWLGPLGLVVSIYIATNLLTEIITNNAAAALIYPIAMQAASQMKVPLYALTLVIAIAATACFSTPIGHQTHAMVYTAGGYHFKDYLKSGLVLNLLFCIGTCALLVATGLLPLG